VKVEGSRKTPTSWCVGRAALELPREILTKLPEDADFSGGIFANANRLVLIFEFPPMPVPINHRYEAVEGGRNGVRRAVFHPHTESRLMFAFIDAVDWLEHSFTSRAVPALNSKRERCPIQQHATGKVRSSLDTYLAQWRQYCQTSRRETKTIRTTTPAANRMATESKPANSSCKT
jgi:hypothetical protein